MNENIFVYTDTQLCSVLGESAQAEQDDKSTHF
jgi:hypothetical protein